MNGTLLFSLCAALACAACGGANAPAKSPSADLPMPSAKGTKRALVLVDDAAPPPARPKERAGDDLSTPRIVQKILGSP